MLFSVMKPLTFLMLSPSFTAITFRFGLEFNFLRCGTSALQIGHHVAQNTTTIVFLPMYGIRGIFSPLGDLRSRSLRIGFSEPVAALAEFVTDWASNSTEITATRV